MCEEEAIKNIKKFLEYNKEQLKLCEEFEDYPVNEEINLVNKNIKTYETILNLIERQNLKIDQQKRLLDIQEREISKQLETIENQKKEIEELKKENLDLRESY